MIDFATKNDTVAIRELWDICFPEGKEFNDYFFDNIFVPENTLVLKENNTIISMAQMIPYSIKDLGEVTYIYGAGTNPNYRALGYMKYLLEKSFEIDKNMGRKASILIPAQKSLFDYYKRVGYENGFYIDNRFYTRTNDLSYSFRQATYNDIENIQSLYNGDIVRDFDYFKTQIDMFNNLSGNVFVLYQDNKLISYGFSWFEDNIDIQELVATDSRYYQIMVNHIMKFYNQNKAKATILNKNIPFGMIKYHTPINNYNMTMNLMYN